MKGLQCFLYQPLSTAGAVSSGKGARNGAKLIRQRVPAVSHPALRAMIDVPTRAAVPLWSGGRVYGHVSVDMKERGLCLNTHMRVFCIHAKRLISSLDRSIHSDESDGKFHRQTQLLPWEGRMLLCVQEGLTHTHTHTYWQYVRVERCCPVAAACDFSSTWQMYTANSWSVMVHVGLFSSSVDPLSPSPDYSTHKPLSSRPHQSGTTCCDLIRAGWPMMTSSKQDAPLSSETDSLRWPKAGHQLSVSVTLLLLCTLHFSFRLNNGQLWSL